MVSGKPNTETPCIGLVLENIWACRMAQTHSVAFGLRFLTCKMAKTNTYKGV